ncbi:MAG: hypothetical protein Q9201_007244 [Fulgogasparrea decipioides]
MKADPTKNNWYGTALHAAAEAGEVDSIHELLAVGVDVNIRDKHGRVPLICAADNSHTNAMRALLEGGADVNYSWENEVTPLFLMVEFNNRPEVIRTLLTYHANPNVPNMLGYVPLHVVAMSRDEEDDQEVARLLLEHGAEINFPNQLGHTALHFAAARNNVNLVQLLLKKGAHVNAETVDGTTALYAAVSASKAETTRILLDNGADMGLADDGTRLEFSLSEKQELEMLLEAGFDGNRAHKSALGPHYRDLLKCIHKNAHMRRHRLSQLTT